MKAEVTLDKGSGDEQTVELEGAVDQTIEQVMSLLRERNETLDNYGN